MEKLNKSNNTMNKLTFTVYLTFFILLSFLFISCSATSSTDSTNGDSGSDGDNGNGNSGAPLGSSLEGFITNGTMPANISSATDNMVVNTLGRLGGNTGASINAVYVTESGSGNYSGSNWNNAHRGTNLRTVISNISDASSSKVYVVLIGAGTYKTTTGSDTSLYFSMKNHTAIIGGFDNIGVGVGSWTRSDGSVTAFDGDIGTPSDRSDNTERIFVHNTASGIDHTAVLYRVEIRNGNGTSTIGGIVYRGAGMHNNGASLTIVGVTFISNFTGDQGGGMYNNNASPLIINSSFIGNESAGSGGGMFNLTSSPIVVNTTFVSNSSSGAGGAIINQESSTTLVNVTMVGNSASVFGGGIYDFHTVTVPGSVVMNSIAWGNTTGGNPDQIRLGNGTAGINITLAGTVLQGDTNAIDIQNTANPFNIVDDGVISNDASLGSLTDNRYMPISTGSSAENIGYHMKVDGTGTGATLYYSDDNTTWYTNITSSGLTGSATPPNSAVYLTKYDITGRERTGRPDAGAYEAR